VALDNVPSSSRNTIVEAEEASMDIRYQVNLMEEDDTNNIVEPDDGTTRLIHDIFAPIDEENFDDIHDVPMLEKAQQPIYEVLRTNSISYITLLVNLRVLNHFSNTCLSYILRYVIQLVRYT
jgi:hypothetical protein